LPDFTGGIDQTEDSDEAPIRDVTLLAHSLSAIELPAVGAEGVSIVHFASTDHAVVLHVDWSGRAELRHQTVRAYYAYTAAHAGRHLALLYQPASYGIYAAGTSGEISNTARSYKEFLTANERGFAWVDYGEQAPTPPVFGAAKPLGPIVFQAWNGTRSTVTDSARYRARLDLSATHVAFVEYASTAAGTVGQVVVQPLAGGAPIVAAPSANHQDRPAIDGDWVVWEEYVSQQAAVIRARHLTTGEVRDLSSTTGFRTNPDIRGTRVVWEDQRSGIGDIYFTDLSDDQGERIAVSGPNHSAATRLTDDGLIWLETLDGNIGLLRARWAE
jgi:beta propeller repeat protein